MIRSVGDLSFRLSHLQEIHADLLEKVSALASLRKQVQQKEQLYTQISLLENNGKSRLGLAIRPPSSSDVGVADPQSW